jgi:hypothetical protein
LNKPPSCRPTSYRKRFSLALTPAGGSCFLWTIWKRFFIIGLLAKCKRMNIVFVVGGSAIAIYGAWIVYVKGRNILNGRESILGSDIKLFIIGIACIVSGIIVVIQHI